MVANSQITLQKHSDNIQCKHFLRLFNSSKNTLQNKEFNKDNHLKNRLTL